MSMISLITRPQFSSRLFSFLSDLSSALSGNAIKATARNRANCLFMSISFVNPRLKGLTGLKVRASELRIQIRAGGDCGRPLEEVFRGVWTILGQAGIFQRGKPGTEIHDCRQENCD